MSEDPIHLEFDAEAMSARLADLTEQLCHLDYQVRDAAVSQDPILMSQVQGTVSSLIFNLPLVAVPTVIMYVVSQLNGARNLAGASLDHQVAAADMITDAVSFLAAQDADVTTLATLLDLAKDMREMGESSPFGACEHDEEVS